MTIGELQAILDDVCEENNLNDPTIYIRIGNFQTPLSSIKAIQEDDNFYEGVILQDKPYEDIII